MYPNSMLFGGIFAILIAGAMVLGALLAIKRGFFPALVRFGMIIASLVVAILLAPMIAGKLSGLYEKIMTSLLGNTLDQITQHSPSTIDLLYHFPVAIIAPILFIVIFYVLKALTLIVFRFVKAILPSRSGLVFRLLGGALGAIGSLICVWAILVPLWGMISTTHTALETVSHADTSKNPKLSATIEKFEQLDTSILGPVVDNFTADIFTDGGNSALYRKMTQFEFHGQKMSLSEEVSLLSQTASDALAFSSTISKDFKITDLTDTQLDGLRTLTADIEHSDLLRNICAEWISALAVSWQKGEPFMGIPEPQSGATVKPLIRAFYGYLATTNETRIADDFNCFIDLLDILNTHGILDNAQTANLLTKIGNKTFVTDLTGLLNAEDRLRITLADLISSITGAWEKGSDYEGIAVPKTNELFDPVMTTFFGILATTDDTVITDDMTGLSNIVGVLENYDVFNTQKSGTEMGDLMMKTNFIADLNAEINRHPRFVPLLDTVTSLGLSAISSQLNISLPDSQTLTDLASSISNVLNEVKDKDGNVRLDAVDQQVQKVLVENKVDVPDSVSTMIAQVAVEKFAEEESVTQDDIKNHLLDIYGSTGDLDGFFN